MQMITGILIDDQDTLTFIEVCEQLNLSQEDLRHLLEHGIVECPSPRREQMLFNHTMLTRIQTAVRLQHDLGVNAPGAALALDLLDELTELRKTLRILQQHLKA